MNRLATFASIGALLLGSSAAVGAQQDTAAALAAGDEIRVRYVDEGRDREIRGLFVDASGPLLLETDTGRATLRQENVRSIRRLEGHRSRAGNFGRGLLTGGLIGGAGGALIGLADGDDGDGFIRLTAGEKAAIAGIAFGGAGALIGGLVGLTRSLEQWRTLPVEDLRLGVWLPESGAVGLTVSFRP